MEQRTIPFQITIGARDEAGDYPLRAAAGDRALETKLDLPPALRATAARLLQPETTAPLGDPEQLGRQLGQALFPPRLRALLIETARAAAQEGARLQIQLQIGSPEVAALPWEWAALGTAHTWSPALREDYALVRISRRATPAPPVAVRGPLVVLAIGGPGQANQLAALEDELSDAVAEGRVELRLLDDATPARIAAALAHAPVHVLHCAAPVAVTPDERLWVGIGGGLDGFDFCELVADHPTLRLITIAGGAGSGGNLCAAPPLLGAILIAERLPAAVTFSGGLPAGAAAIFAAACYTRLADGALADEAVTAGRAALAASGEAWGMPQLRLLAGAGRLFAVRQRATRPAGLRRALPLAAGATLLVALLFFGQALGARGGGVTSAPPGAAGASQTQAPFVLPFFPAAPPTATPTPLPDPLGYTAYTVGVSDTLDLIAARLGSDARAIAATNFLAPGEAPRRGRAIVVPLYRAGAESAGAIVSRGNQGAPRVALTFDIEIDDATLYAILDVLRERGLKATFFVTGGWVMTYPEAARAIAREGHEIGNHSLTHPFFSQISPAAAAAELSETERIVREIVGVTTRPYFRFPYGDSTEEMIALLGREGYIAYHWSADDDAIAGWVDWAVANPAQAGGSILLMHGRPATTEALPGYLDRLIEAGLQPTTLGEALR